VTIDGAGAPIAVRATQRLDVRGVGDYSFRVGAPVVDVRAAPGSARAPGLRTGAVLWEGFNPGRRVLAAVLELDRAAAAASLPLRVETAGDRVTLRNLTTITVSAFAADALAPQLRTYLASLRRAAARGEPPTGGGALVTSTLERQSVQVSAPLLVQGTVGRRRVRLLLGGSAHPLSAAFPRGRVRLEVTAQPPHELLTPGPADSGRALLARATRASLEFARTRQYETFLGNPDVTGPSSTTYVYVSGRRAPMPTVAVSRPGGHGWLRPLLVAIVALATAALAAVAWAKS
jgi:hypothetical protein